MSDITETMTVKNGQAAVKTVTVAGKLSPKTSATDTIALVETSDGKQAALKVYNINGGGGGGAGGDYLPLSGGTLNGLLTLTAEKTDYSFSKGKFLKIIKESEDGSKKELTLYATSSGIALDGLDLHGVGTLMPVGDSLGNLGQSYSRWASVYTTKLNNGADLIVPTEGGTLARLEDIQNAGGGAGGDYLPLSGGTMTGPLGLQSGSSTFKFVPRSYGNLELTLGGDLMFEVEYASGLLPAGNGNRTLGRASRLWKNVYTNALNNGADIAIPTEGGTMARIEDINAAVGDISTALTAILGE